VEITVKKRSRFAVKRVTYIKVLCHSTIYLLKITIFKAATFLTHPVYSTSYYCSIYVKTQNSRWWI